MHLRLGHGLNRLPEADAGSARGHIDRLSGYQASVGELSHYRRHDTDAHRGPQLPHLARHSGANSQNNDVEYAPQHVHDDRARPVAVPNEEARNGDDQAGQVKSQHDEKWLRDLGVEKRSLDHAALGRHIELAQFGVDESHKRRQQDVRCKHGFVYLVPPRVPVLALNPRVGDVREREVRQRVSQNGRPIPRNIGVVQQQIDQRRGQKDQPGNRI